MGKLRSKDGCLTCRSRHVKCDELRPVCGQCRKADRRCRLDDPELKIRRYSPRRGRKSGNASGRLDVSQQSMQGDEESRQYADAYDSSTPTALAVETPAISIGHELLQEVDAPAGAVAPGVLSTGVGGTYHQKTPPQDCASPFYTRTRISSSQLFKRNSGSPIASHEPTGPITPGSVSIELVHTVLPCHEASLVNHYVKYLGRWLDCTDASRQFSLKVPRLVQTSPLLLHAVMSFAAQHAGDTNTAQQAHERSVELLIPLLDSEDVAHNEILLCAIVILRVFEQLNVINTGSDQGRHLAGCSALLRASQGQEVDPSVPGLRQAAFWVYMRQCLYNACVSQQAPNVDLDLILCPAPEGRDPISDLRSETAWANTITWICASVIQLCFGPGFQEPLERMQKWTSLTEAVENWARERPKSFDPFWSNGPEGHGGNPFPQSWFTADWHVMAFGYYHLACMLLIIYKPAPKFAVRGAYGGLRESDARVMDHARAICGACWSEPAVVPSLITLCHTIFIWGPLMTDRAERAAVIKLLQNMEREHSWPTSWIINSLQGEWTR